MGDMFGESIASAKNTKKAVTIACPHCGASVSGKAKFCPECGQKILHECPKCGAKVSPKQKFCPECGHKFYE